MKFIIETVSGRKGIKNFSDLNEYVDFMTKNGHKIKTIVESDLPYNDKPVKLPKVSTSKGWEQLDASAFGDIASDGEKGDCLLPNGNKGVFKDNAKFETSKVSEKEDSSEAPKVEKTPVKNSNASTESDLPKFKYEDSESKSKEESSEEPKEESEDKDEDKKEVKESVEETDFNAEIEESLKAAGVEITEDFFNEPTEEQLDNEEDGEADEKSGKTKLFEEEPLEEAPMSDEDFDSLEDGDKINWDLAKYDSNYTVKKDGDKLDFINDTNSGNWFDQQSKKDYVTKYFSKGTKEEPSKDSLEYALDQVRAWEREREMAEYDDYAYTNGNMRNIDRQLSHWESEVEKRRAKEEDKKEAEDKEEVKEGIFDKKLQGEELDMYVNEYLVYVYMGIYGMTQLNQNQSYQNIVKALTNVDKKFTKVVERINSFVADSQGKYPDEIIAKSLNRLMVRMGIDEDIVEAAYATFKEEELNNQMNEVFKCAGVQMNEDSDDKWSRLSDLYSNKQDNELDYEYDDKWSRLSDLYSKDEKEEDDVLEETKPARYNQHLGKDKSYANISASRSNDELELPGKEKEKQKQSEDNNKKTEQLKKDIKDLGLSYIKTYGAWRDEGPVTQEDSFLVPNISKEQALELGKKYGQYSVIFKDEGEDTAYMYITLDNEDFGKKDMSFDMSKPAKFSQVKQGKEELEPYSGWTGLKKGGKGYNLSYTAKDED